MSEARALFQSQLRSAVRDARQVGPVRVRTPAPPRRTVIRLWLPLTPLWVLLAPFALLLAPALKLSPQTRALPAYRTAFTVGGALIAMSGTVIDIDGRDALVRVRIF
ncbi:MAG TPA: hypothetical protein VHW60_09630 [Caulobacteraceae bacterium]|jgi:hypothetical protein|nr:hypothetical protein [Caulobacteraceae bacterium]